MYVSQIAGFNNPCQIRVQKKSAVNIQKNTKFRGSAYSEAFNTAMKTGYRQINSDVFISFIDLLAKVKFHPRVTISPILDRFPRGQVDDMDSLFHNIFSYDSINHIDAGDIHPLAKDNGTGSVLAWALKEDENNQEVGFFEPTGMRFIKLNKNSNNYTLNRNNGRKDIDQFEFYSETGNLKVYKNSTHNKHYNPDGSQKTGKIAIINIFRNLFE